MHGFCNSCESFYTYVISTTTKYSSSRRRRYYDYDDGRKVKVSQLIVLGRYVMDTTQVGKMRTTFTFCTYFTFISYVL